MATVKTISQIISALLPIAWVICLIVWVKTEKLEETLSNLSFILVMAGIIFCLSQGLDLIGLE